MTVDQRVHIAQLQASLNALVEASQDNDEKQLTSWQYSVKELQDASDLVAFRTMQVKERAKFLLTII